MRFLTIVLLSIASYAFAGGEDYYYPPEPEPIIKPKPLPKPLPEQEIEPEPEPEPEPSPEPKKELYYYVSAGPVLRQQSLCCYNRTIRNLRIDLNASFVAIDDNKIYSLSVSSQPSASINFGFKL